MCIRDRGNYLEFVFPAMGMRFISVNDNYDSDRNFGVTEMCIRDRFHAVPLTSKIHKKTYLPTHIFISSFKAVGLRTNSIAQCEQLCLSLIHI